MPIEYTNQPIKLKIKATLEMEDGQIFDFEQECMNFNEDGDTIAFYFDTVGSEVYDKLEEFLVETEDEKYADDYILDDYMLGDPELEEDNEN